MKQPAHAARVPPAPRQRATIGEKIEWLRKYHPPGIRNMHVATDALIAYARLRARPSPR